MTRLFCHAIHMYIRIEMEHAMWTFLTNKVVHEQTRLILRFTGF